MRRFGILYQSGALWSSMTLAENVALPLGEFTDLSPAEIAERGRAQAGARRPRRLRGFLPLGDQRRHAQARRPRPRHGARSRRSCSSTSRRPGSIPISSRLLDDLILELRDSLGATIVVVTHELASIFAIGDNSVFLDTDSKTMIAQGDPRKLRDECPDPRVRNFLLRGGLEATSSCGSGSVMSKRANPKLIGGFVLGAIAW